MKRYISTFILVFIACVFFGTLGFLTYEVNREPVLIENVMVGKITEINVISGGYKSSAVLEVKTNQGRTFVVDTQADLKVGEDAFLHKWDKKHAEFSLSSETSRSSWYLK
jgi:hypothetical protein